jgi:hypothetical protein
MALTVEMNHAISFPVSKTLEVFTSVPVLPPEQFCKAASTVILEVKAR